LNKERKADGKVCFDLTCCDRDRLYAREVTKEERSGCDIIVD